MNCYCYETEENFILCVENVEPEMSATVEAAYYQKVNDRYLKVFPLDVNYKELIKENFARLGESMFLGKGRWEEALKIFAEVCAEAGIRWYVTGSASEAVTGVKIAPHDLDLVPHTEDFFKIKDLFSQYLTEPFVDNKGTWAARYFGRLCINGVMVDIAADDSRNEENHAYEDIKWGGCLLKVESLESRYKTEIQRNRKDRITAIEEFMKNKS